MCLWDGIDTLFEHFTSNEERVENVTSNGNLTVLEKELFQPSSKQT